VTVTLTTAPTAGTTTPLAPKSRLVLLAALPVLALACAAFAFTIPPDAKLGAMVRFVMFHGASTWVNMLTFTLAGAAGVAFAATGRNVFGRWGEAFRWISLPLWTVNTVLGLLSMKLIWGGILWNEPRLMMTFGLLAAAVVILAVQLIFDHPTVPAVLDAALAAALWVMVLVLPNLFHPNSPVFSSGNWDYIGRFLGMVLTLAAIAVCVATLIARRRHVPHPHAHAVP
jgi:hypothetical protein